MAREQVGLVIRQGAVEVVVLTGGLFGGGQLARQARIPVAAGLADQPADHDQQLVQAMRDALSACQVPSNAKVAVAVPAKEVLLRCFMMPLLPKAEWEQAIQFEVRKYIPFKIDQLIWNYQVIESRATKQMAVIFTGLRTEVFTRVQGWLSAAGVAPMLLEGLSASIARAVGSAHASSQEGFIGVVDVERESAQITIVKQGLPYLSRELSLGAAEDQRHQVLSSELRVSLDFFAREHAGAVVDQVLLFGEQQTLAPWCASLAEQLGCRVELGTLPVKATEMGVAPLEYAAAVGLGLGGLRGGRVPLELLARAMPRQTAMSPAALLAQSPQLAASMARSLVIQAGVALGILACVWIATHRQVAEAQAHAQQVMSTFPDVGWGLRARARPELETLQPQLNTRLAFLRTATQQRVFVVEKLDALAKVLPDGVWMDQVEYRDPLGPTGRGEPSLALRGACFLPEAGDSLRTISNFLQQLKQDAGLFRGFATAQVSQTIEASDPTRRYTYRTFQVNCQAERRVF